MSTPANKSDPAPCSFFARTYHRAFGLGALRPHAQSLLPYLNRPRGRFVEVGARDGSKESLTPYLENALGWKGLLIEPWPHLFHKCRKRRKKSVSLNVAAVDRWLHDSYIEIRGMPPEASIRKRLREEAKERIHGRPLTAPKIGKQKPKRVHYVTTNCLGTILDKAGFDKAFDLLVLNLPGYEANALEGMDFDRYKPTFVMVRANEKTGPLPNLPAYYEQVASSPHDRMSTLYLYRYADFGEN